MAKKSKANCLIEGCEREVSCRGLCVPCHSYARKLIARGEATWESLVASGLALDSSRGPGSPFMAAFRAAAKRAEASS